MTNNIFRPVEFWKSAVMTMPDNSFFELMRSVFGKIKTPFNKQQLVNDLETFLLREDIQKTIAAYIDKNDTKIIAAAAVFGEPTQAELNTFFEGELNYAQLQDIIVNLEERFILYRFNDENAHPKGKVLPRSSRIALNPVLEPVLLHLTTDISVLFEETPVEAGASHSSRNIKETPAPKIINDRILAALFSFVSKNKPFYRSEGVIRKKVIEAGKLCFPDIDLSYLLGALQILGLFYVEADNLVPDKKRFDDFAALSTRERSEYCTAALLAYSECNSPLEILPPLFRMRIREITNFIHHFIDSIDADYLYPEQFLKRLIEILKQKTDTAIVGGMLIDIMEKTGLLITESSQYKCAAIAGNKPDVKNESPFIAIDSGSAILVYPEIEFKDALSLTAISSIQEARIIKGAGEVVRFEIGKDSIAEAFDNNISADEIIDLLKRLSCNRVDEALIWNIKDWEKRYNEVSLKKGIVLTLSEDRRYLVETMPLKDLITETLAPGVYLLPEDTMNRAEAVLQKAGIDIIAHNKEKSAAGIMLMKYFPALPSGNALSLHSEKILPVSIKDFSTLPSGSALPKGGKSSKRETDKTAAALTENLHNILKKLPVSETGRAELSARIDRRLILCEEQLKEADIRYEKLEARHMDYAGKQNIAKQAIAQQSPLEVIWRSTGKEKSLLGIPKALEKEETQLKGSSQSKGSAYPKGNGDLILIITPADSNPQDEDEIMRIPLAKISFLRRIKKSIFEI